MLRTSTRRGLALSLVLHVAIAVGGYVAIEPSRDAAISVVDIEIAPPAPAVEALPATEKKQEEALAGQTPAVDEAATTTPTPTEGEGALVDAGVDAPPDAPPDARPRRKRPDAGIDAGETMLATDDDAGVDEDGGVLAGAPPEDGGVEDGGTEVASVDDAGAGGDGGVETGTENATAVDGAPTSAGTAANLLAYFPRGHKVTAMIRFDRLRGTEWLPLTERLLKPMPDYRRLFGATDAKVGEKVDTIIISTPEPQSAIATTLVARTNLARGQLRTFLATAGPVMWSATKGGLLGRRSGPNLFPGDKRVFLSPFRGWFLLANPADLGGLTTPATGDPDSVEATAKLPSWLAGIRTIEAESGTEARGPALVLTMDVGGKRFDLGQTGDFGLGVKSFPTPQRLSVAAEVVKQGWIVRGNMRFASAADADEFVASAELAKERIGDSMALQLAVGKPVARVVANLSFAKAGERVSYATSVSISDMQAILAVATQVLDTHFAGK